MTKKRCDQCGKPFDDYRQLNGHMAVHSEALKGIFVKKHLKWRNKK